MKKSEVDDAILSLWVLVNESEPVVIGSQSLHGKYPDVADTIMFSREVDVILPNQFRLGNWLVDVVGDGTPFAVERGYYIDHVLAREGLPVLADGWRDRSILQEFSHCGETRGVTRFISPEDLVISKMGAARPKDFVFVEKMLSMGLVSLDNVYPLVDLVPSAFRDKVREGLESVAAKLHQPLDSESNEKSDPDRSGDRPKN